MSQNWLNYTGDVVMKRVKGNPANWTETWRKRCGLCQKCAEPAVDLSYCEQHRQEYRERSRLRARANGVPGKPVVNGLSIGTLMLRILRLIADRPGAWSNRLLMQATGVGNTGNVSRAVQSLRKRGLVEVERGRGPKPSVMRVKDGLDLQVQVA